MYTILLHYNIYLPFSIGSGTWTTDGLTTVTSDGDNVSCISSHLTVFAVLVNVGGVDVS